MLSILYLYIFPRRCKASNSSVWSPTYDIAYTNMMKEHHKLLFHEAKKHVHVQQYENCDIQR